MIRATAPGSIMITGEHAVVYGHRAIVAAVEQRMTVDLHPRSDRQLSITSEIADPLVTSLDALPQGGEYRFVLAAIAQYLRHLTTGFDLTITSQINPTLGLGSSAAVTVATLGALAQLTGQPLDPVHSHALQIVRGIQGRGSGADLAASTFGGMLAYRALPQIEIAKLPDPPPLCLCYCGYKTPTGVVLQEIADAMLGNEARFEQLYTSMGEEADRAITAATAQNWPDLATSLTAYQGLMQDLGVSDVTLDNIIAQARADDTVLATKISGSGLGDCVLALGGQPDGFVPANLAQKGLTIDV